MKIRTFIFTALVLGACGSRDEAFCDCIDKGDAFSQYAQQVTDEGKQVDTDKFEALKDAKEKACADYLTMGGEEMLQKKATCKE